MLFSQSSSVPLLSPIILRPPSLVDKLLNDRILISSPFHIKSKGPPKANTEKNAAIPRHHPGPTLSIQAGTKNGRVRLNDNLYTPIIAADSDACP